MVQLRGRIEVRNNDGSLAADSGWGPWMLGNLNLGTILGGLLSAVTHASNDTQTLTDTGGTSRTVLTRGLASFNGTFNNYWGAKGSTNTYARLAWGNGSGTPTRTDSAVSGVQDTFNSASVVVDNTAGTVTVSGSKIWTGSATNVTRLGLISQGVYNTGTGGTEGSFLLDHTTITSTAVATGQTVTVSYQISY